MRRDHKVAHAIAEAVDMADGARRELESIARSGQPVVCGPWTSEIGFELLYWIPMLRRFREEYGLSPDRLVAVSRGGARPWYAHVASAYVDLFEILSPAELRDLHRHRLAEGGSQKQMDVTDHDRRLLEQLGDRLPAGARLLHPAVMYRLFWPMWVRRLPLAHWQRHTRYRLLLDTPAVPRSDLPAEYAALKLYFSDCLPDTAANRTFAQQLVEHLTERMPVVLLSTGFRPDEHGDVPIDAGDAVVDLSGRLQPLDNLTLQTDVVRSARMLVSTYGGFSYLGPLLGVRTLSFYSEDNFNPTHLDVARRAFRVVGTDLAVLSTHHADAVAMLSRGGGRHNLAGRAATSRLPRPC
jgi:hypothetical protein